VIVASATVVPTMTVTFESPAEAARLVMFSVGATSVAFEVLSCTRTTVNMTLCWRCRLLRLEDGFCETEQSSGCNDPHKAACSAMAIWLTVASIGTKITISVTNDTMTSTVVEESLSSNP